MSRDLKHPQFVDGHGWYVVTTDGNDYLHSDGNLYGSVAETSSSRGWYLTKTKAGEARQEYYEESNMIDSVIENPVTSQPLFYKW